MEVIDLKLQGLKLLKPQVFQDDRGFFLESFKQSLLEKLGIHSEFAQDNHSYSQKDCIRGLHFQSFPGQAKLVRVASGRIFDVVVDIRPDSPTFGQWESVILDGEHHHQLFIPNGFAHGFCILSNEAHVMYKVSSPYDPFHEKGFRWNDSTINIDWPTSTPLISGRDATSPLFHEIDFVKGLYP